MISLGEGSEIVHVDMSSTECNALEFKNPGGRSGGESEMWVPQMGLPMHICRKGPVSREDDYRQFELGRLGGALTFRG